MYYILMLYDDQNPYEFPWMENFKKNPIPVLLKSAPLPVRYRLLSEILDDTTSDDYLALQKNLRKHQPRRKRLADQKTDGTWAIDGKMAGLSESQKQTLQLLKQLEVLNELIELSVTHKQEKALLGMREVLRILAEQDLPLRLHHNTQAVYLAVYYELEGNPIIKNLIRDLIGQQNPDGGWSSMKTDEKSCYWSSLYLVWSLAQSKGFQSNRALTKGLKYLQDRLLLEGESDLLPGMQVWDTLISGSSGLSILSGGTLRYLETVKLLDSKNSDRKTYKLLDWLIDAQLKSGLWPSIVSRDKQGDHEVTLRVLKVLKHFQTQRVDETLRYESEE